MKLWIEATCPAVRWTALEHSDDDFVYEFRIEGCPAQPDQTELGRFVAGRQGVYRVAYFAKGGPLPAEQRAAWRDRLRQARVR